MLNVCSWSKGYLKKTFVIHNSLAYDKQRAIRERIKPSDIYKEHFNNRCPTLIFIGRLTPVKRLDLLIDAVSLLNARNEYYNIVFVGDGEMRSNLEKMYQRKG